MNMERKPRYATNVAKAHEVILWLASHLPGIDVYHLVKAAYYAEKDHTIRYGRPIIGDEYRAARYGPLPQVIYGLLTRQPIDILALGNNGDVQFEVRPDQAYVVKPCRDPNLRRLSDSEVESLEFGLKQVKGKSFDELVEETHADPAYLEAMGEVIDYRDFIPEDDPDKDEKREYIQDTAQDAAL